MTTTLITGKGGTPHITSGDMGAMQAGIIGNGSYLLQGADGEIPRGHHAGRQPCADPSPQPRGRRTIRARHRGRDRDHRKRHERPEPQRPRLPQIHTERSEHRDRRHRRTQRHAKHRNAADPTVPSGSIHSASGTAWIPIARIPISGITPGTPVMLIKQLPPMSKLWDSVTQTCQLRWQDTASFVPASYGASNTITVKDGLIFVDLSSFRSTVKVGDYSVWLFEEGVKPSRTVGLGCVANVAGIAYGKQARWNTNGSVTLIGGVGSADIVQCFSKIIRCLMVWNSSRPPTNSRAPWSRRISGRPASAPSRHARQAG